MRKLLVMMLFVLTIGFINVSAKPIGYNGPETRIYKNEDYQTILQTFDLTTTETINQFGITTVSPGLGTGTLSYTARITSDTTLSENVLEMITEISGENVSKYSETKTGVIADELPIGSLSTGNHTAIHLKMKFESLINVFYIDGYAKEGGLANGEEKHLGRLFDLKVESNNQKFYFGDMEEPAKIAPLEWSGFKDRQWYDFIIVFLDLGDKTQDKIIYYVDGVKMHEHTGLAVDFNKNISDLTMNAQASNANVSRVKIAHLFGEVYNPITSIEAGLQTEIIATQTADLFNVVNVIAEDETHQATLSNNLNVSIPSDYLDILTYYSATKKIQAGNVDETFNVPITVSVGEITTTINVAVKPRVDVMLTTKLDGTIETESSSINAFGSTYSVEPDVINGKFMFWTVNGVVRTDLPQNLTIKVQSEMNLVAHFARKAENELDTDKYSVVFLDANLKYLDARYVKSGEVMAVPTIESSREGTTFDGWAPINNYDATAILSKNIVNPGVKTFYVAKYKITDETTTYQVTANKAVVGFYPLNGVATIPAPEGNFTYWVDVSSGAILSYLPSFSLTVLDGPVEIESVYDPDFVTGPMVSIRRFFDFRDGKDTFIGHYELGSGNELIEFGFIHDDVGKFISKSYNALTNEFMVSVPDNPSGSFQNNDFKMRAYMTYRVIMTGEVVTVYNKSSYEITFEVTAPTHTPANTNQVYLVGEFNDWGYEDTLVVRNPENGKFYYTMNVIQEPGTFYEYLYVLKKEEGYHELIDDYFGVRVLGLTNNRKITQPDNIITWNQVDVVVKLGSLPDTTGTNTVKLIGSMTNWDLGEQIPFVDVNGTLQVILTLNPSVVNEFKVYLVY